jgi:hypothetical protein
MARTERFRNRPDGGIHEEDGRDNRPDADDETFDRIRHDGNGKGASDPAFHDGSEDTAIMTRLRRMYREHLEEPLPEPLRSLSRQLRTGTRNGSH